MLLGRLFAYRDAHRYRIGPNYTQLPVNAARSEVNSYSKDGAMRYSNPGDPVYAPNSHGGPHVEDDDFGQLRPSGSSSRREQRPRCACLVHRGCSLSQHSPAPGQYRVE
ncbi:Catalase [Amycolatopsis marina]|uniref:Catalase n=1 Tax=Amycolatopsis marina TaxID=490629 RepID=A0A1I1CKI7_9PSEU|nr:Catalase [Amycolatopsis marina]